VAGVTEELNKILDALDKGTVSGIQFARYQGAVKKILEREPKNVFALYLKAKLLILSTKPQDRIRIKTEVLNLVNEMAALAHSAVYYHRKYALLNDLNVHDDDIYQEQKNACQEIQKLPQNPSSFIYHSIATKFLGGSRPSPPPVYKPPVSPPTKSPPPQPTTEPTQSNRPRADFTVDKSSGEPPLSVQFFDRSSGNPNSWNWEFGDGSTSREGSPVHTYDDDGQYTVALTVTNKAGSDVISKNGLILVAVRSTDSPDSDGIYGKAIAGMVRDYPEIIDLVLAGPHKKKQLKGYVLDAFGGETPKEFHTLMNCVDEEIPLIILENLNEKIKLNAKVETKKESLKNKGLSPEFVNWAVEVWMLSLINENVTNAKNSTIPSNGDPEILF
jgi:PKD repeat protein